jgi:hypothetical protein
MKKSGKKSPACIQYVGLAGITEECKQAVMRLLQYGDQITLARILSSPATIHGSRSHGLLLTINTGEVVAVKSGFSSGYLGEGPSGLSFIVQLLKFHNVEIEEYDVDEEVIERLDLPSLTSGDIEKIDAAKPVWPRRWYDYITDRDEEWGERGMLWQNFPPVMPFAIIDNRITDLALNFFENPDKNLLTGYRRLEDIVRKRTDINEHGVKLFSEAFYGEKAKLGWTSLNDNERNGRANLFTGAYMAYRNPRAHRELEYHANSQLIEFMLLNQLYVLEKESVERVDEMVKQPHRKTSSLKSK